MTRIEMFQNALSEVKSDIDTLNKCKAMLRKMKATAPGPIIEVIDEIIENQTFRRVDLEEAMQMRFRCGQFKKEEAIQHEKNLD